MIETKVKAYPDLPREVAIQVNLVVGDHSLRKDNGLDFTLVWDSEQTERGTRFFLCQQCLSGEAYSWHDRKCVLFLASQETHSL